MPRPHIDITGQRFGAWTVISFDRSNKHRTWWNVRCDCGTEASVRADSLKGGESIMCVRCASKLRRAKVRQSSGGLSSTPTWQSWSAMRDRCSRPACNGYENYGGRGITVCDRWSDYRTFLADMGERPPGHTLDRIDPSGHYTPENCRWSTVKEQNRNRSRTVFLEANGRRQSLSAWAEELGFSHITLYKRYAAGWTDDAIINTPKQPPNGPKRKHQRRHPNIFREG